MLRKLRIKNFKVWKDTGDIRMAPLTLFFGANSSGKSSIGQFLMMLKQTIVSPDRKAVFFLGDRNTVVHLGTYRDMVHGRNPDNTIDMMYEWHLPDSINISDTSNDREYRGNILSFEGQVGLPDQNSHAPIVNAFRYLLKQGEDPIMKVGMDRGKKKRYELRVENFNLKRNQGRPWGLPSPVRFYGFPDEVTAFFQNTGDFSKFNLTQERLFDSIFYLGPMRQRADRLYSWTGIEPESVGFAGENTIAALLAAKDRYFNFFVKDKGKIFQEIIAQKLEEMGLIERFEVQPISAHRQEYEVKVNTMGAGEKVDLPDVGFGISQVLPVLVQCFYAPSNSIIIIEQPEIHLHPRAQAILADVMIDVIRSREKHGTTYHDRNIQLIIETHSEHFLRRLQRRIAEDKIDKELVSAYFAGSSGKSARLNELEIDSFGNISNWPEHFFGDEMSDITEQAKAAIEKRRKMRKTKVELDNE